MNTWLPLSLLAVVVLLSALSYVGFLLLYRLTRAMLNQLRVFQRDQNAIVSELLAHRTLAETGNQFIAGQMLQHSNAHDMRAGQPRETYGEPPIDEEDELPITGPHESPEIMYGDDEMQVPLPGEE